MEAGVGEDVPEGSAVAGGASGVADAAGEGVWFDEAEDTVAEGEFAGGDGGPDGWGEDGFDGGEVAADAAGDEAGESGHGACGEERVEDAPVGGVPADEEDFARG